MSAPRVYPLDAIRTDGWFARIGESIGSFEALCEILGEHFFAFSMITGARITALTVDRRVPENTLVDFVANGSDDDSAEATERLTLSDFRRRLVAALLSDEPPVPAPESDDAEAIQNHIGARFLLLAPLYGYSLDELQVGGRRSLLRVTFHGSSQLYDLAEFRDTIRAHVREDLENAASSRGRTTIDLETLAEAKRAAVRGEQERVIDLLGSWPAPLTILLRTPEGQMLTNDARESIASGLGLLGTACAKIGDRTHAEEVLRLGIQYAGDSRLAGDIYARLGDALLGCGRPGEAIGVLRRAANLGAAPRQVWPQLCHAFVERGRYTAALSAMIEAMEQGLAPSDFEAELAQIEHHLGPAMQAWKRHVRAVY